MILILLMVIIFILIIMNWIHLLKQSSRINANGPIPWPILGNVYLFFTSPSNYLNILQGLFHKYGDVLRVHFFSEPYLILNDPKYIGPLVASMDFITKGRSYNFVTCWLGQGLLASTGQRWQSHRRLITPAFHFNILKKFRPVFCKNQKILTEKLRNMADGRSINIFPLAILATLDNVTESIMGVSADAQKHSESDYVKSIQELAFIISLRIQNPLIGTDAIFNLLPYKARQDKILKKLRDETNKVIKARCDELQKAKISCLDSTNDVGMKHNHAFLDLLLLNESDGEKLNAEDVREEVTNFMFAGHDTTAAAIAFTMFCLSKHRDVQEKIYEELKSIFGDDMSRDPTYQELHQMKYLEMVIKESMRLFPPVPLIERLIEKDCVLEDLKLIKGISVLIDIFHMQRHPDLYDDPLEFRPERFEAPLKNPFHWLVFSAGPRNCIGQKFAMMELKVSISEMVKNFIILPSDVQLELLANIILKSKTGVHVKLVQRK